MKKAQLASLAMLASMISNGVNAKGPNMTAIDGSYELTKRVLANGTIVRPPGVRAIYTLRRGRFSLNLFSENADGRLASESTIGRYSFSPSRYCEWIEVTTRSNIDHPGVTNKVPTVADHCARVSRVSGRFVFVVPGENVTSSFGSHGFTAKIDNGDRDYWTKID